MKRQLLLASLVVLAALRPFADSSVAQSPQSASFPGWPKDFQGHALEPLPLTNKEQKFLSDFPGRIGKFSDGRREIILRWITRETRKVHPASDCFRGAGYSVRPLPVRIDGEKAHWGCFEAKRDGASLRVCERIRDGSGKNWADTSAWFWSAFLRESQGPWWSEVIAEQISRFD